jgi:hypothetical protein
MTPCGGNLYPVNPISKFRINHAMPPCHVWRMDGIKHDDAPTYYTSCINLTYLLS